MCVGFPRVTRSLNEAAVCDHAETLTRTRLCSQTGTWTVKETREYAARGQSTLSGKPQSLQVCDATNLLHGAVPASLNVGAFRETLMATAVCPLLDLMVQLKRKIQSLRTGQWGITAADIGRARPSKYGCQWWVYCMVNAGSMHALHTIVDRRGQRESITFWAGAVKPSCLRPMQATTQQYAQTPASLV